MKLYVGNIPLLANEEALTKWCERSGLRVESVDFVRKEESRRCALVEVEGERLPPNTLRHLKSCVFWGRHLDIHMENRKAGRDWPFRPAPWADLEAA